MRTVDGIVARLGAGALIAACAGEPVQPDPMGPPPGQAGSSSAPVGGSASGGALASGGSGAEGGTVAAGGSNGGGDSSSSGGFPVGGAAAGASGTASGAAGAGAEGSAGSGGGPALPRRVLLYHFSTLVIASVPAQLDLLEDRLETWGYEVERSKDPADIDAAKLASFAAVGMINTCFEPFGMGNAGSSQGAALASFVEAGGGLFGTHCASVTYQSATPPHAYNQLLGGRGGDGYFDGKSSCQAEADHPTVSALGPTFDYVGNLDNTDYLAPDTQVLVRCRWSTGAQKDVPVSWYRTPGQGRVFYTNFAKEDVDLRDATLAEAHIFPGLSWVLRR